MERLWFYRYEGAMLRYLQKWIEQLRWQRLKPFEKLAMMVFAGVTQAPGYRVVNAPALDLKPGAAFLVALR